MLQEEFFKKVVAEFNGLGIPYMVTGSMASNFYGQPRLTHDIDLVLTLPRSAVGALAEHFPGPRYYLSPEAALEAVENAGMFNIIDTETGLKADLWILDRNNEYRIVSFERRKEVSLFGIKVYLTSAEDVILSKLDWYRKSGETTQQLQDARAVYQMHKENLDFDYLKRWAEALDLSDLLKKAAKI